MNLVDKVWATKLRWQIGRLSTPDYIDVLNLYYAQAVKQLGGA